MTHKGWRVVKPQRNQWQFGEGRCHSIITIIIIIIIIIINVIIIIIIIK